MLIMFSSNPFRKAAEKGRLKREKVAMTSNYRRNWMGGLELTQPFLCCHCSGEGGMRQRLLQINKGHCLFGSHLRVGRVKGLMLSG